MRLLVTAIVALFFKSIQAQVQYPAEVKFHQVNIGENNFRMAYMDVSPTNFNGKTILLLHGKNFSGYYWKDILNVLTKEGYRVIVPDQLGFGRSDKPNTGYSFHMLAYHTMDLLDSLQVKNVTVLGHSMGGMLAIRLSLLYPNRITKLILENPIGLEDYKRFVRYQPIDTVWKKERNATYASYKKYQQTYYPVWKDEYEDLVRAQAEPLNKLGFDSVAFANALTFQMIMEQPVIYELEDIHVPVLLIIGQSDRTVVGKDLLTDEQKKRHGLYPALGKDAHRRIKQSRLVELNGVGHIPHIQEREKFLDAVLSFIK